MSDPTPFHVYQARPDVRLPWDGDDTGRRWNEALGVVKDAFADGATIAARCSLLSRCPADALALHGLSLGWPQAPGELVDEYRARLLRSFALEEWRGTNKGIGDALRGILSAVIPSTSAPSVEILEAFTAGWGRNAGVAARARWFNVVIRPPHPFGADAQHTDADLVANDNDFVAFA